MKKLNLSLSQYRPLEKYSKFGLIEAAQISNNSIEVVYYDINNKMKFSMIVGKNLCQAYSFLNTINDLQKKVALQHFRSESFEEDLKEVFEGNVITEAIKGDENNANKAI